MLAATAASAQGAPTTVKAPKFTNNTAPTFEWSGATDPSPSSGIGGYTVEIWKADGSAKARGPYTAPHGTDPHTWTLPEEDAFAGSGADDGEYQIRVWTCDTDGNTGADFGPCTFLLDTQPPVLSNVRPTGWDGSRQQILADFTDACAGLDKSKTEVKQAYNGISWDIKMEQISGLPTYNDGDRQITIGKYMPGWYCDGEWTFTMVTYDRAGNRSDELVWKLNVDATAPTAPGEPVAGNVRDDGRWYINTLRPTFGWAASRDPEALNDHTPGSGLRDYWFQFGAGRPDDQTDDWAGALVNEAGILPTPAVETQQLTPPADLPLVAGVEYSARVKAYDNLGNCTAWVDPLIIYDPDPPTPPGTPTTTSPTTDKTPVWKWAGSKDAISGIDLYHIQIRRAGSDAWDVFDTFLDIPDVLNPGGQTWEQAFPLADGTYEIRVRAMDVAGNYSAWSGVGRVTVDATPPAAPGIPKATSPTRSQTPPWTWNPRQDMSEPGETPARYNVYLDDRLIANVATNAFSVSDYWTHDVDPLEDGTHHMQVTALDALGNESARSTAGLVVIDLRVLAVPVMAALPDYTNAKSLTFAWSTVEGGMRYDLSYIVDPDGNPETPDQQFETVRGIPVQEYTLNIENVPTGAKIWGVVCAFDAVGNVTEYSDPVSITVDREGPVVTLGAPPTTPTTNPRPTWTWSGGDALSGVSHYIVTIATLGDEPQIQTQTTETSFTPVSNLPDGVYVLKVYGVDNLGNVGAEKPFDQVSIDTTAPAPPAIKPILKGYNTPRVTLEWDKVADHGNGVGYVLQWAKDAGFSGFHDETIEAARGTQCVFSFADTEHPENKGEGEYWFRVKTISTVNGTTTPPQTKESGWSAVVSTTYDVTGPAAPVLTLKSKNPTNEPTQEWTWSRPIDAVNYDLYWSEADSAPDASAAPSAAGVGNVDLYRTAFANPGEEKTYYVWVRGIDALGNLGDWSNCAGVRVDMKAPAVSITSPATQKNTNLSTFTWTWTGDDGEHGSGVQGYWVKLNDEAWSWTTEPVFTSSRLQHGANILRVKGVDNAGNEGAVAAAHEVTLVDAVIFDVHPEPGAHAINEVSTIAFSVAGLYDGIVEVLLGNELIEDVWRLVTVVRTPELAKFYILLDADVMQPGMLTVTIGIGDVTKSCDYKVLGERTGFGFGRLRPW